MISIVVGLAGAPPRAAATLAARPFHAPPGRLHAVAVESPPAPNSTTEPIPAQPARWQHDPWSWVGLAAGAYTLVFAAWTVVHFGGTEHQALISDLAYLPISLFAAGAAARLWRMPQADPGTRRAWGLLALAFLATFAGDLAWFVYEIVLQAAPFPSLADAGYLLFYPLIVLGLLSFPYAPVQPRERVRLSLDIAITAVGSWMLVWYLMLSATVTGLTASLESVIAAAYPVGDLAAILALIVVLFRQPQASQRSGFWMLLAALALFVVADTVYAVQAVNETYVSGDPLDSLWAIAYVAFGAAGLAAHANLRRHGTAFAVARRPAALAALPYGVMAVGDSLAVWVFAGASQLDANVRGLAAGVVALAMLVSLRQILELRENRRLNQELMQRLAQLEATGSALNRAEHLASLGTLAAGVAHEINNPLAAIIATAGVLRRRIDASDFNRDSLLLSLSRIERAAWHGARIVTSLLTYARGSELSLVRAEPERLLSRATAALQRPASAHLTISSAVEPDAPVVSCDEDQIVQVLVNLLENAYDAITPPGNIRLRAARGPAGHLVLSVTDTGGGMAPEVAARAFDPFFTTKPFGQGTGLGLSLARGLVRAHGGGITIDTASSGTTVTVTLPPEPPARPRP